MASIQSPKGKESLSSDHWLSNADAWSRYLESFQNNKSVLVLNYKTAFEYPSVAIEMYHDWIPGSIEESTFSARVRHIVVGHARSIDSYHILQGLNELDSSRVKAVGAYELMDAGRRWNVVKKWKAAKELRRSRAKARKPKPICVFLGGPPGSGKSFFVEQCANALGIRKSEYSEVSLSGVANENHSDAIEKHIEETANFGRVRRGRAECRIARTNGPIFRASGAPFMSNNCLSARLVLQNAPARHCR